VSTFKVEVKKISKIYPHSNADKLELAQVEGMTFQFAIPKNIYRVGDEVVYFPVDSILPEAFIEHQGIRNHLSGKDKNRVKTATLRGEISQGYVNSISSIKDYLKLEIISEDLTELIGVVKYEQPEIRISSGNLISRPEYVYVYDIEGCDRFPEILEKLIQVPVFITEKMEGMNFWASIDEEKKIMVGQRNFAIENLEGKPEHSFWQVARRAGVLEALDKLSSLYHQSKITIRGELVGPSIQGNYYRLKQLRLFIFDIEVNKRAFSFNELQNILQETNLSQLFVPVLAKNVMLNDWLNGRTIQQASNGLSILNLKGVKEDWLEFEINKNDKPRLREGVVIKPMQEQYISDFGRLFLKQRDPIYLDKTGF
jgi:RNA ligase (TIGR02306 family)